MKFLVTGASGFIGTQVVDTLLYRGHEVIASSRSESKACQCKWYGKVQYLPLSINRDDGDLYIRAGKPDVLIHTAWDRLDAYNDPYHLEVSVLDHYFFIKHLLTAGLKQCLILGTCLEYGMQQGCLHEDLEAKPELAYPLAKHVLRQFLLNLQSTRPYVLQWVRMFYLFGEGQRSGSLLAQLDNALEKQLPAFDMSKGDQIRDYLDVSEAARIISRIAEHQNYDGVLNCCSGRPVTVRSLVEEHLRKRAANIALNLGKYPYPAHEPFSFWGDRTRLDSVISAS